ncbi:MAG TPA: hypothetical protein VK493_11690 [Bryobacteraceae bacterium]|nr:hypothetical protein [Bryobacteraceae bacterium]
MLLYLCIVAAVVALYWFAPAVPRAAGRALHTLAGPLVRWPFAAVVAVAALPLVVRALLLPVLPIPLPRIHDEFSYLLAGDTFAHGRVTNPTHPLWPFFESFHVLAQPSYMSKYPPAQGLFLAAGQMLFGHPWWGVFLSVGIMCGAVCWMLEAWLPRRWAIVGGVAVALQFGITDYWMNSYWGGAAAAIGGSLLLGALGRLLGFRRFPSRPALYGAIIALGVAVLLNSRPWEGMTIMLPAGVAFVYWLAKNPPKTALRALLPCSLLIAVTAGAMLYYAWRITGNPLRLPYVAVHKAYSVVPLFVWQPSTPAPEYHHAVMQRFYTQWETHYQSVDKLSTWRGWMDVEKTRLRMTKNVLFSNVSLILCALFLGFLLRRPGARFLAIALAVFLIGLAVEGWAQIHYFGPVIGVAAALKMLSLRRLSAIRFGERRLGLALASALLLCGGIDLLRHLDFKPARAGFARERDGIEHALEAQPGSHVVLVRYAEDHNPIQEWVFNKADIDASKVVWARDMSPQQDQQLFDYFKGRHFWLLTPDAGPLHLAPLEASPAVDGKAIYSKAAQPLEEGTRAARP